MRGCVASIVVTSLLVERMSTVYVSVDLIAIVDGVKRLSIIVSEQEVVNILCKAVDVIILIILLGREVK